MFHPLLGDAVTESRSWSPLASRTNTQAKNKYLNPNMVVLRPSIEGGEESFV